MRVLVLVLHSPEDQNHSDRLSAAIESFGYDVWHTGLASVGDVELQELSDRMGLGGPIVICGTARAAGSKWFKKIVSHAETQNDRGKPRVFPIRLEIDANIEPVAFGAKVAECCPDFHHGLAELRDRLTSLYPPNGISHIDESAVGTPQPEADFDRWVTPVSAFSESAVKDFRARLRPEIRDGNLATDLDISTFLSRANLAYGTKLYAAGVLLFTDHPETIVASAYVQCVQYSGKDQASAQEGRDFYGPIVSQLERAMTFIESRIGRTEVTDPGAMAARYEFQYPMVCIREILANAICHRDYLDAARHTHVRLFENRIEIISPGFWGARPIADGVEQPLSQLKSEPASRNERLASALRWIRLVETQGSGIPNALSDCGEKGAPSPMAVLRDGMVRILIYPRIEWDKTKFSRRGGSQPQIISSPLANAAKIAPSRLFTRGGQSPQTLMGRSEEVAALDAAWIGPEKRNLVTLVAWAGIGKSSLAAHWAASVLSRPDRGGIFYYFDWSFYSQGLLQEGDAGAAAKGASADNFVNDALSFFGDSKMAVSASAPWAKGERLAELVSQHRTLLILDGIEPLQDAHSGELLDDAMRALLRGLAANNQGLCLITTRQHIPDLATWNKTTAPEWNLQSFTEAVGASLLQNLGVKGTEEEMKALSAYLEGHALSLNLVGRYLKRYHGGDVRRFDHLDVQKAAEKEQGGHAFRILDAYERAFQKDGRHAELAILRMLGLFDRPATPDCIAALCEPPIHSLTDLFGVCGQDIWNEAINNLSEFSLVQEHAWEAPLVFGYTEEEARDGRIGLPMGEPRLSPITPIKFGIERSLDAHPLIREFFGRRLQESQPDTWRTAHERLFVHLSGRVPYWPEGLQGLRSLYQAVGHGCRAGRVQEACDKVYRERIQRGPLGYSSIMLGAQTTDLSAISGFFSPPWTYPSSTLNAETRAWLLSEAAFRLRSLGRLSEAHQATVTRIEMARAREAFRDENAFSCSLSELNIIMGDLASAERIARDAVNDADRIHDIFSEIGGRCALGSAFFHGGKFAEASQLFETAEKLTADYFSDSALLYSVSGFTYCETMLAEVERLAWLAFIGSQDMQHNATSSAPADALEICSAVKNRAESTLGAARQQKRLSDIGLDQLMIGRATLYHALLSHSPVDGAAKTVDRAVQNLRNASAIDQLPGGLLTRAWIHFAASRSALARLDLDEAQNIARRGPMPLFLADTHLYRSRLFGEKEELAEAETLIVRHGYLRRQAELCDAKLESAGWK